MNQIIASLAHVTSEATFAAANFNLDFSIFKFEAPASYKPFGDKLSLGRKEMAEYGSTHITARKLGALFNEILPKTPTLIAAYGARVSEILPLIDPGSDDLAVRSLFGHQLGADGTTIWAAATSGDGAVPVHLLACLLANMWNAPQAVSIWVQMVAERKTEIADGFEKGTSTNYPVLAAFRQEITRQQLAEWDASARAWVRAADEVKRKDLDSLRLIINSLDLPVDSEGNFYQNVTRVWRSSMSTIEKLLNGIPQTAYDGATVLGISSWHIFPNIISFKPLATEITYNDPLVRPGGVLTVGLAFVSKEASLENASSNIGDDYDPAGVFWSLSLAHLKFYGPPVQVSHNLGVNAARVNFDQFMLLALGSLSAYLKGRLVDYARLFTAIWTLLEETASGSGNMEIDNSHGSNLSTGPSIFASASSKNFSLDESIAATSFMRRRESNWIRLFHEASVVILESEGVDHEVACMLANFGRRRGTKFWSSFNSPKFFGLCELPIIIPLLRHSELQIGLLRSLAQKSKTAQRQDSLLLIRYPAAESWVSDTASCFWEAATAIPFTSRTSKRDHNGNKIHITRNRRFIIIEGKHSVVTTKSQYSKEWFNRMGALEENVSLLAQPCTCPGECLEPPTDIKNETDRTAMGRACPCKLQNVQCTRACHFGSVKKCARKPTKFDEFLDQRLQKISAFGEDGFVVYQVRARMDPHGRNIKEEEFYFSDSPSYGPKKFEFIAGCPQEACLYGRMLDGYSESQSESLTSFEPTELSYDDVCQLLKTHQFSISRLISYLDTGTTMYPAPIAKIANYSPRPSESLKRWGIQEGFYKSLRALACAADVYRILPSVTVAMSTILLQDFHKARWAPTWSSTTQELKSTMTRPQTFACLAMLETGNLDLHPDRLGAVMAMASGDSLFISSALLCDPCEVPNKHEIIRVLGNIGRPGLAMLIAPEFPHSKDAALEDWKFISHAPFKGESFDGFKRTSLHLSFTGYTAPLLSTDNHGVQDVEVYLLEAVIKVYNGGEWIGDLNVLKTLESEHAFTRVDQILECGHDHKYDDSFRFVVFDSWEEFLEGSEDVAVARAHHNWQARLSLTCIAVQRGYRVFVLPRSVCWKCLNHGLQGISAKNNSTTGNVLIM